MVMKVLAKNLWNLLMLYVLSQIWTNWTTIEILQRFQPSRMIETILHQQSKIFPVTFPGLPLRILGTLSVLVSTIRKLSFPTAICKIRCKEVTNQQPVKAFWCTFSSKFLAIFTRELLSSRARGESLAVMAAWWENCNYSFKRKCNERISYFDLKSYFIKSNVPIFLLTLVN